MIYKICFLCFVLLSSVLNAATFSDSDFISIPMDVPAYAAVQSEDLDLKEDLYFYVVEEYAAQGYLMKALAYIKTLPDGLKLLSKPLYISAFLNYYELHGTDGIIEGMDMIGKNMRPYVLEECVEEAIALKRPDDVLLFYMAIRQDLIQARAAEQLVAFYAEQKDFYKASELLEKIKFPKQKDMALKKLLVQFAKHGETDSLDDGLSFIVDPVNKDQAAYELVVVFAKQYQFDQALTYMSKIQDRAVYEKAGNQLVKQYALSGKLNLALELAKTFESDEAREEAVFFLGLGFAKTGNIDAINHALEEITSPKLKSAYIKQVSHSLATQGYLKEAFGLSNQLSKVDRERLLKELSYELGLLKEFHFSFLTIQQLNDEALLGDCLAEFAFALAESARIDKSIEVLKAIPTEKKKEDAIYSILLSVEDLQDRPLFEDLLSSPFYKSDYLVFSLKQFELAAVDSDDWLDRIDHVLDELALSKNDELNLLLAKFDILLHLNQTSKAKSVLKQCRFIVKKNKESLHEDLMRDYIRAYVRLGKQEKALKELYFLVDSSRQLYFFDLFQEESSDKKNRALIKRLKSFSKSYKQ